ncbi:CinA family protein, partial [Leucobacter soli]
PRAEAAGSDPVELSEADFGVATTGVAGPDPDPQTGQPAGTVWLGISSSRGSRAVELHLGGTRAQIRASSVEAALTALLDELTLQT